MDAIVSTGLDQALLDALGQSQAIVQFQPDGLILDANPIFLELMGYTLEEVVGRNHSMFCRPGDAETPQYLALWAGVTAGAYQKGMYHRVRKDDSDIWLMASYNPVLDTKGNVLRIVKFATDISKEKNRLTEFENKIAAFKRSQPAIEFDLSGHILYANEKFLSLFGYTLDELLGQHHRILCEPHYVVSPEYQQFWAQLAEGEFHSGEYRRVAKDGHLLWIQGSYNTLFGPTGKPYKVVKYAYDVTERKARDAEFKSLVDAVNLVQAVVEFDLDGNVLKANSKFLETVGYAESEVLGHHHSMFCDPAHAQSEEYEQFWKRLQGGEPVSGEFHRVSKKGEDLWLSGSYNVSYDALGKPLKFIKFATDSSSRKRRSAEFEGLVVAINRVNAVVELDLSGRVLTANDNFLQLFGYELRDVVGQHHRMFCDASYVRSPEYQVFWERLSGGEFEEGEFRRIRSDGSDLWLQASYNPVFDSHGKPYKVVKLASDITASKKRNAEFEGKMKSVDRAQAVIEFDMRGRILYANDNFLSSFGYKAEEVVGEHHRLFCKPNYARSAEYVAFWDRLGRGEFEAGEFCRLDKNGKEVWIQASYNPIMDDEGRPYKVVKFATDITETKQRNSVFEGTTEAISRSQAVIEFDLQGNVLQANNNFLRTLGYTSAEIQGKHHKMFCHEALVKSTEYRNFWADLAEGQYKTGRFQRIGKHDVDVWIQATYNPILDLNGKPFKVVKFAVDVTEQVNRERLIQDKVAAITEVLDEMTQSISSISGSVDRSEQVAKQTQQQAVKGNEILGKLNIAIGEIQEVAKAVKDTVDTISDIASQTNLLAFNAAIEAARAGEHGLGFSVVADEVRKLAEKSTLSAHQIDKMIQQTALKVVEGARLSDSAGTAFGEILQSISSTSESIAVITDATKEQVTATRDVALLLNSLQGYQEAGQSGSR
jgi:methyl-accepting chemotaxis protein